MRRTSLLAPERVTVPQLTVVGAFSAIALVVGMVAPANAVNMTLSAHDVGGLIMPPGMIMTRDTPPRRCGTWPPSTRGPRPPRTTWTPAVMRCWNLPASRTG
jgi:hypothetical protein